MDCDTVSPGDDIPEDAVELLILDQLPSVGLATIRRLTSAFGSARAALNAPSQHFRAMAGPVPARECRDPRRREWAREALDRATASGAKVVTWNCAIYPDELHQLSDPPPLLFLRGREELLHARGVSVVGARRATKRGRDVAERLGGALGRAGVSVVSGLALGVDGAAHAGALRAEGDTVAVLGTGTDVVYPQRHRRLFDAILERGLLLSEFPPGTKAAPFHFPRRNRILAALSSTTVVVEAGRRSGALITVDHALDLGREVWAVPGPIEHAPAAGSNRLLADGARALVSIEDFVAVVLEANGPTNAPVNAPTVEPTSGRTGDATATSRRPSHSGTFEAAVLAALSEEELLLDDLAARAAIPVSTALAVLTTLELYGEVERLPGMRFRRAA